jgi:hypothetical protein
MVQRIVRVGALLAAVAISVASCSDDEEPAPHGGSTAGAGGESGEASGVGGTGGRGGGGAESGGTGGDPSGTGGSGAVRGGASGAGGNGAEGGAGAAGRGSTVECSSQIDEIANLPCANPGEICEINEQCCCGQCEPEVRCRCNAGTWECEYIDLCMDPMCGGAGGTGGAET